MDGESGHLMMPLRRRLTQILICDEESSLMRIVMLIAATAAYDVYYAAICRRPESSVYKEYRLGWSVQRSTDVLLMRQWYDQL
mmetsp:Transcript_12808/g.21695  ORF Transcript_12808/g.21695 Transcript_12808/m.21695 type:complete len:83 (-) Transcript_12808:9-257(-)